MSVSQLERMGNPTPTLTLPLKGEGMLHTKFPLGLAPDMAYPFSCWAWATASS